MEGKVGLFREYVNGFQIPSHKQSVASSQEDRDCLLEFGCAIGYYVVTPSDGWEKKISWATGDRLSFPFRLESQTRFFSFIGRLGCWRPIGPTAVSQQPHQRPMLEEKKRWRNKGETVDNFPRIKRCLKNRETWRIFLWEVRSQRSPEIYFWWSIFSLANGQTRPWEEKERCSGSYRLAVDMRFHLSFTSWAPIQRLIQTISQIRNKSLMVLSSFGIRSGAVFGIILLLFGRRRAFFLSSVNPWIKARRG